MNIVVSAVSSFPFDDDNQWTIVLRQVKSEWTKYAIFLQMLHKTFFFVYQKLQEWTCCETFKVMSDKYDIATDGSYVQKVFTNFIQLLVYLNFLASVYRLKQRNVGSYVLPRTFL